MDRCRLSIAYFAPQTLYLRTTEAAHSSKLEAYNPKYYIITLQKEREWSELWIYGIADLRNKSKKGIERFSKSLLSLLFSTFSTQNIITLLHYYITKGMLYIFLWKNEKSVTL